MTSTHEADTLLPCPFCGGEAMHDRHQPRTGCPQCGVWFYRITKTHLGFSSNKEAEADAWNTRAALSAMHTQEVSVQDVLYERSRQIQVEGFNSVRDDGYTLGELASAAASYSAHSSAGTQLSAPSNVYQACPAEMVAWPWNNSWWKPVNPRQDLVKAAALILAEIDRMDRALSEKPHG